MALQQPCCARKVLHSKQSCLKRQRGRAELSRELAATASAPTGQNFAAVFGCHAGAKAVGSLTLQNAGLKCTLHGLTLSVGVSKTTSGFGPRSERARSIGAKKRCGKRRRKRLSPMESVARRESVHWRVGLLGRVDEVDSMASPPVHHRNWRVCH